MNKKFINDRGVLFELMYFHQAVENRQKDVICKRVLDQKVFRIAEKDFRSRFQSA